METRASTEDVSDIDDNGGSCYAIALGSGRTIIVLAGAMLLFAAALYRKIVPFALALIFLTALLFTVNFSPRVLGTFSPRIQRRFSILLLNRDEAATMAAQKAAMNGTSDCAPKVWQNGVVLEYRIVWDWCRPYSEQFLCIYSWADQRRRYSRNPLPK